MKVIRAGSGLGDSIYLRSIAAEMQRRGEQVVVRSNYPEVFSGLGVKVEAFNRFGVSVVAHYTAGKNNLATTQFQDMCAAARLAGPVPLAINWSIRNHGLVEKLLARADGKPIVIVHGGRAPMARTDGFGSELLPSKAAFDTVLKSLHGCFLVRVGRGERIYDLSTDLDLSDSTSITDLFDLASVCDGVVSQCSFAIPLAESFDKPLLVVLAAAGLKSKEAYVRTITPQKVLHKQTSTYAIDDWTEQNILRAVGDFVMMGCEDIKSQEVACAL